MDDRINHFRRQLVSDALTFIEKMESAMALTMGKTRPDLRKRLFVMHLDLQQIDCSNPEVDNLLNIFFDLIRQVESELGLATEPS